MTNAVSRGSGHHRQLRSSHARTIVFVDPAGSAEAARTYRDSADVRVVMVGAPASQGPNVDIPSHFESLEQFADEETEASIRAIRWVREWSNRPHLSGQTIKERMVYRGRSLWWFFDTWLLRTIYVPPLHWYTHRLDQLTGLLDDMAPRLLVSLVPDPVFNRALRLYGDARGIAVQSGEANGAVGLITRMKAVAAALRLLPRALWFALQRLVYAPARDPLNRRPITIFCADHWQSVYDQDTGAFVRSNLYFHSLIQKLTHRWPVRFVVHLGNRLGMRYLREKSRQRDVIYKPLEAYISLRAAVRAFAAFARLRRQIHRWCADESFQRSWSYRGINCWPLLAERLRLMAVAPLFEAIATVEMAKGVMDQDRPEAVIIDSEQSRAGKALIGAARLRRTPVLSVAHGLVGRDNPYHNLVPEDLSPTQPASCEFPLPDIVTVYGEADIDVLVGGGGFPADRVCVTGAPRWDWLASVAGLFPRADVCRGYGMSPDAPVILLTTQTLYSRAEEEELVGAAFRVVHGIPRAQLVVKMHPMQTVADERWYRRIADKVGARIAVLEREGAKLYPLLNAADVMLTMACTTAIEASLLDRPVVVLDFWKRGYRDSFHQADCLLNASSSPELDTVLRRVLFDLPFRASLGPARAAFVREYAYRSDGRAAERVAGLLQDLVNKATSR